MLCVLLVGSGIVRAADFYWVGGSGNWSDAAHWANQSGGQGGAGVPGTGDDVYVDDNSFTSSGEIELSSDASIGSFHWSVPNKEVRFNGNNKDLTVRSGFEITSETKHFSLGTLTLAGSGNSIIHSPLTQIKANVNVVDGTWVFSSVIGLGKTNALTIDGGSLDMAGFGFYAGALTYERGGPLNLSGSRVIIESQLAIDHPNVLTSNTQLETYPGAIVSTGNHFQGTSSQRMTICTNGFFVDVVVSSDFNGSDISCNGECDGEITASAGGTPGPFSFEFNGGGPFTSQTTYGGLCAGTFSITAMDSSQNIIGPVFEQCTEAISVVEPPILDFNVFAVIDPSCPDSCDGEAFVNATGGTGSPIITWIATGGTGNNPTDLCRGWNPVNVTDDNGCMILDSVLISNPPPINAGVLTTGVSCFGICDGTAVSSPSGGNGGPFTWDWENGSTADNITECVGNWDLTVFDVDGCPYDTTITITTPLQIQVNVIDQVDNECFGDCQGELEVSVSQGTAPYDYQWMDDASGLPLVGQTNPRATGLCAGDYYCVVTDANGCQDSSVVTTITEPPLIVPNVSVNDVLCFGDCNGTGTVSAIGGVGGFSYEWFDATPVSVGTGANINTLCVGDHTVQVTDANACTVNSNVVTVNQPSDITTTINGVDILCNGQCTGSVTITVGGGTPTGVGVGYTIDWYEAPNTPIGGAGLTNSNLCAGDYFAIVTDANGCDDTTAIFTINEPPALTLGTNITDIACAGDCNGQIDAIVGGGTPDVGGNYNYQWFTCSPLTAIPGETNATISNLCPDAYGVQVTDDNGCTISNTSSCILITDPPVLDITINNTTDASCGGFCDGTATSGTSGGTGNITVEWFDAVTDVSVGTGNSISTLCTGTYYAVATDDNGCQDTTAVFPINDAILVTGNLTTNDATCFGFCDGDGSIVPSGGTAPYSFEWIDITGGGGIIGSADIINGLCAGDYTVQVIDVNGCASPPIPFTITESPELFGNVITTDASCNGICDGTATVNASGGVPGYTYNWNPAPGSGQGTPNATNMCAGTYQLIITDNIGCTLDTTIIIDQPVPFDLNTSFTNETCFGDCDGTASVTIIGGGVAPFDYNWSPAPGGGQGTPNATGLCVGTYDLTITDAGGCDSVVTFNIIGPPQLTVNATVTADNPCNGDCVGVATATAAGGTGTIVYNWSPNPPGGQGTNTATGLCAGAYTITVTDDNGCTDNDNVNVTEPAPYDITTSFNDVSCNGACDGDASVTVISGGTPAYSYTWNTFPVQTTPGAVALCAGNYDVTISDLNGCDSIVSFTITEPLLLDATVNTNNSTCFGDCTGTIDVTPNGGIAPYNIVWYNAASGSPIGQTGTTASNLCDGSYFAEVTDASGCVYTTPDIDIIEDPEITASVITTESNCTNCIGTADVTAIGGTGNFVNYQWSPAPGAGQGSSNASAMCSGFYSVEVFDNNGCSAIVPVSISDIPVEVVTTDSVDVSCFGSCDGQAIANYVCSDPPCTNVWLDDLGNPIGQTGSTATGLCAGIYAIEITNNSGCVTVETVEVGEPTQIDLVQSFTDPSCNGDCDGTASVVASGGAGGYSYNWVPAPLGGQGTANATGLCAGNVDVTVTDVNGCTSVANFTLTDNPVLDVSNVISTDISCFGFNDGTATVLPSGGTGGFTYEWFDCVTGTPIGQTGQTATGLAAGSYQVIVTDAAGCAQTSACVDVLEPLPLAGLLSSTDVICNGACDGTASVVASGGNNNYSYQWFEGTGTPIVGGTGASILNLCPDTYTVEITDLNGCSDIFGPVTITEPNPYDVTIASSDATCFGGNDGTADITVNAGGTAPYTYTWTPAPGGGQGTPNGTGLSAGTYNVLIEDLNGCDTTVQITIASPPQPDFSVIVTPITCNGDCNASITSNVTGGTAPYTYNWSPAGETTPGISNLCDGTYTLNIQDAAGCVADTTIIIVDPAPLTVNSATVDAACGVCDGEATLTIAGGYGTPYTINWVPAPGVGQGTVNATGLCAGIYTATVQDPGGCQVLETVNISDVGAETLSISSTDATCFDNCDGTATVTFTCGDAPCSIEWYDAATGLPIGQTTNTATGLCAGDYVAEVTNGSGCISTAAVTVDSPTAIDANETITLLTCNGGSDASIEVNPSGGNPGYTYNWTPAPGGGQGTNIATGLNAGTWDVLITDNIGCDTTYSFTINEPAPITASGSVTDVSCNGSCDGSITTTVLGGAFPYTYQWQDAALVDIPGQTNDNLSNVCAGDYNVVITDQNGCTNTQGPFTIIEPILLTVSETSTDVLCNGDCDGTATVTIAGGTAPFTTNWFDNATGLPIGQNGTTANGLCPGDYYAEVTDANGCSATTLVVTISEPPAFSATASSVDASCNGVCDGEVSVSESGGTGPYTYSWTTGGNPVPGGSNATVSSLCAGNYDIIVTDANGCTVGPLTESVTQPIAITASIFVNDANCGLTDGSASVTPAGGVAPYSYQWLDDLLAPIPGETGSTIAGIGAGTYYVEITDADGCSETIQVLVSNLGAPSITVDNVNDVSCFGDCDGSIDISITGGTGPYSTVWNPGGLIAEDPSNLCPGTYTVQVTDASGCVVQQTVTVNEPTEISETAALTDTDCGVCNGSATLTVSGGTGPYTYDWSNGDNTATATNLCAGTYDVDITDANGCTVTDQVSISSSGGPSGQNVAITPPSCPGACDGSATVTVSGGTPPYSYFWVTLPASGSTQNNLCAGHYIVQASDATGCSVDIEFDIVDLNPITAVETINPNTCGLCDGSISVLAAGGLPPYTYNWSSGGAAASESGLCQGIYTLDITDAAGCTETFTYTMNASNGPVVSLTATDETCSGDCDGEITSSVSNGIAPYTYAWFDGVGNPLGITTPDIQNLCPGDYILEVVDAVGCGGFAQVTIDGPTPLNFSLPTTTDATCAVACNGTATAVPTGGTLPYSFDWSPGGQTSASVSNLCSGIYTVDVTDANGCTSSQQVTINDAPTSVTASIASVDATCGVCDGEATVTAAGGSSPYSYAWSTGGTGTTETGLCSGVYSVQVTDADGCQAQVDASINDIGGPTGENVSQNDATCAGASDGNVSVTPIGGTAPYSYLWVPGGSTSNSLNNIPAGNYSLEISDANNCIRVVDITIGEDPQITSNPVIGNATCGQCDGTVSLLVSGGDGGPYTFSWSGGLPPQSDQTGLCAGIYTVDITDGSGCSVTETIAISSTNGPDLNVTTNNESCAGVCDGDALVVATTGSGTYNYAWDTGDNTDAIANLCGGTYFVSVEDAGTGCVSVAQATIVPADSLGLGFPNVIDASCNASCDGEASVVASGGTLPYTYQWSDPASQSTPTANGLCSGFYTIEVTDANGCNRTQSVQIDNTPGLSISASSVDATCGQCDGQATVTPAGGTPPYNVLWSDGQTTTTATDLCAGVYTILVEESNGCTQQFDVTINNVGGPTIDNINQTNVSCFGLSDGSADVTVSGGTPPYTYLWVPSGNTTNAISNVPAGSYTLEIIDDNNCISVATVDITEPQEMDVNPIWFNPDCGACNGEIILNTVGGDGGPYTFAWSGGLPAQATQQNLCADLYSVDVSDGSGCTQTFDIPLSSTQSPEVSLAATSETCGGDCDGEITATATGGSGTFNYLWSDGQTSATITGLCPDTYTLTVTDAGTGCVGVAQATIEPADTLGIAAPVLIDASCAGVCDGEANAVISGGTLPITYSWNDPSSQTTSTASGLCAGNYQVTITDANGCLEIMDATINEPPAIVLSIDSITDASCLNTPNGEVFVTATGGAGGITFDWISDPAGFTSTSEDLTGLFPQTYIVTATDAAGCSISDTAVVDTLIVVLADAGLDQIVCPGNDVTLIGSGIGSSALSYEWFDSTGATIATDTSVTFTPPSGTSWYVFQVADDSCSHTDTVFVTLVQSPLADAGLDLQLVRGESGVIGGNPTADPSSTVEWSPSTWLNDSSLFNPTSIQPDSSIVYTLTVTDTNGCVGTDSVLVYVFPDISFPNGFSPNGDGVNEVWEIALIQQFPEAIVEVYNRWGEPLFISDPGYPIPWDGRYNGKNLPVGTYYYIINLNHPQFPDAFTGPITILR